MPHSQEVVVERVKTACRRFPSPCSAGAAPPPQNCPPAPLPPSFLHPQAAEAAEQRPRNRRRVSPATPRARPPASQETPQFQVGHDVQQPRGIRGRLQFRRRDAERCHAQSRPEVVAVRPSPPRAGDARGAGERHGVAVRQDAGDDVGHEAGLVIVALRQAAPRNGVLLRERREGSAIGQGRTTKRRGQTRTHVFGSIIIVSVADVGIRHGVRARAFAWRLSRDCLLLHPVAPVRALHLLLFLLCFS